MPEYAKSLKWYRGLAERKGRFASGAFLVEGERSIRQVIAGSPGSVLEIVAVDNPPPPLDSYPLRIVSESRFSYISRVQTPQGVLAVVRLPPDVYSSRLPANPGDRVLLLEDIQDPGNTGTLIRTAAAFGFSGVIVTENGADPLAPRCVQATAGSVLSVWLRRTGDYLTLARQLREKGYKLVAADLHGSDGPEALRGAGKFVLALGNEAAGLSGPLLDISDIRICVPVAAEKAQSLNVAACGAILMYLSNSR